MLEQLGIAPNRKYLKIKNYNLLRQPLERLSLSNSLHNLLLNP